jgi:NAD(P)-dependent dehydrogenase (short-subunit alcohol dehydrogenase family)
MATHGRGLAVVVITGGSRGIGAATARLAATRGYAVVISFLENQAAADDVADGIVRHGGVCLPVQADVSVEEDVERLFKTVDDQFGHVDALVNNAATLDRQMRLTEMTAARLTNTFAINSIGPMLCAREAVRRMMTGRGGRGGAIVNVSSKAARIGSAGEYVDYAASKGALETFTLGLAREVAGEGVRVNCVSPGHIYTDLHAAGGEPGRVDRLKNSIPMLRGGQPEEVAKAIVWLLSDEASYCTGAVLDVTGGR